MPIHDERDQFLCLARRCHDRALSAANSHTKRTYMRLAATYERRAIQAADERPD